MKSLHSDGRGSSVIIAIDGETGETSWKWIKEFLDRKVPGYNWKKTTNVIWPLKKKLSLFVVVENGKVVEVVD
jgi:hypothetical protein